MLFSVEQAFVRRDEIRAPLKRMRGRLILEVHGPVQKSFETHSDFCVNLA